MEAKQQLQENKKKKMGINIVADARGGGLAGLILLGGAVATAALLSTFVVFKRKQHQKHSTCTSNSKKTKQIDDDDDDDDVVNKSNLEGDDELLATSTDQGLSFLVQDDHHASPFNHHSSNGIADVQNELGYTQNLILDEIHKEEINAGKYEEEGNNNLFCDDSCIGAEEFSFPVFDGSVEKVTKKKESLGEVVAKKVDGDDKVAQSDGVSTDDSVGEKDGVIVETEEGLVEVALPDQLDVVENSHDKEKECNEDDNDGEIVAKKCEELVEAVGAENGMQLSEIVEAVVVDQEIICFGIPITDGNEARVFDVNEAEACVVNKTIQAAEEDEAIEVVQRDQVIVEDSQQAQMIEADEKELLYQGNGKCEEGGQIAAENDDDQQMQHSEYKDILISPKPEKLILERALEIEVVNPVKGDETTELGLYEQFVVEKNEPMQLLEKAQTEDCNNKNSVANEDQAVKIVPKDIFEVLKYPKTQAGGENDTNDENHVGSKNVKVGHEDTAELDKKLQTELSEAVEEEDDGDADNGCSEDYKAAVDAVDKDSSEDENTPQTLSSEEEEEEDDDEEEEEEESNDGGKVEESSETTGDSSLESNAEPIWPAESVQELSLKLKELQADEQNEETDEEDITVNTEHKFVMASTQKFLIETAALEQPIHLSNLKFWVWLVLVPFLLLLLLWFHVAK